jgi:glycerol-3-phosphate dehydrogenase
LEGYGADAPAIIDLMRNEPHLAETLDSALPYTAAEVAWAARHEMARNLDDVLARRLRALFLNSSAALRMAPKVATILARELGRDRGWIDAQLREFGILAEGYQLPK